MQIVSPFVIHFNTVPKTMNLISATQNRCKCNTIFNTPSSSPSLSLYLYSPMRMHQLIQSSIDCVYVLADSQPARTRRERRVLRQVEEKAVPVLEVALRWAWSRVTPQTQ